MPEADTGTLASAKRRAKLLEQLEQRKRSCSFDDAVRVLKAWGFTAHRKANNNSQAWSYEELTIAFHRPHGKSDMDPAAIEDIIDKIEQVKERIEQKERRR